MENFWTSHLIFSLLAVVIIVLIRIVLVRSVRSSRIHSNDLKRRILQWIRFWSTVLAIIALGVIWSTEIKTFAFGILTFMVALVIATKELITCLTGGIMKITSSPFAIGDRISVGEFRGEVIDQSLFSTKLLQMGSNNGHHFTGNIVNIPNSLFLNTPIINENPSDQFVLQQIDIPFRRDQNIKRAQQRLIQIAKDIQEEYGKNGETSMRKFYGKYDIEGVILEPTVFIEAPSMDHLNFIVRVCIPDQKRARVEQEVLKRFFTEGYETTI